MILDEPVHQRHDLGLACDQCGAVRLHAFRGDPSLAIEHKLRVEVVVDHVLRVVEVVDRQNQRLLPTGSLSLAILYTGPRGVRTLRINDSRSTSTQSLAYNCGGIRRNSRAVMLHLLNSCGCVPRCNV